MAELDPQLVDRAVAEATRRTANLDYFFDALDSPDWIGPLRDRGLFAEPPPQRIDEEGYVRAPMWSASRYLVRMAETAPEQVATVLRALETNNERVHEDIVAAALTMPDELARALALQEAAWISSREYIYYLLPRKAVELATHLAGHGEVDASIALIHSLFAPSPVSRDEGFGLKKPQARFADWEYDHLLRSVVEGVVPEAPEEILRELVSLLGSTLDLMRPDGDGEVDFDLVTRIWRPRIADDRDRGIRIEEALVSALRDAARVVRAAASLPDRQLVDVVTARPEELFRRIAMDALAHGPQPDIDVLRAFVVDPGSLVSAEPSVEFRELLSLNASRLPREDIDALVDAVRTGPDVERYRERTSEALEREATDEETQRYVAWWRAARLKLLLDALDPSQGADYDSLLAVAGDADLPVSFEVHTFAGPSSPFTVDELEALDDSKLLELLRTWKSNDEWGGPSLEGFARALAAFAQRNPERTAVLAPHLRELRPGFVQWTFEGLDTALREGKAFDWQPVIALARWVTEQPREIPGGRGDDYSDLDPGWVWTRREIVSLLEKGLTLEDERVIPSSQRADVWAVIRRVAEDADPTPESEERYGGSNMDPLTLALNTTRPRALFAAVAYGFWLQRVDGRGVEVPLFREAPELAALLEAHLDPSADPSTAVRAAIGYHYARLLALDSQWTAARSSAIFPEEDSPLREAAWGAYVIYTHPEAEVFATLREVYQRSAELAASPGHGFRWDNAPTARLGEHLATFYWHETINLDDRLLTTFWRAAPSEARSHVIDFLGRSAHESPELDAGVVSRLLAFWDFARLDSERSNRLEALAPFAWWFSARSLPLDWRIDNLIGLLRLGVQPNPAFVVMEELPATATDAAARAVEAMRLLLGLERERWSFDSWSEHIEQVLRQALDSQNPEARRLAEETTHWLGALGYRQFRSVLD